MSEEIRTGNTGRTNKSVYRQNGNKNQRVRQEKYEVFPMYEMNAYGSLEVQIYSFFNFGHGNK